MVLRFRLSFMVDSSLPHHLSMFIMRLLNNDDFILIFGLLECYVKMHVDECIKVPFSFKFYGGQRLALSC